MSKKIRGPALRAEGCGRNQPVIPSEMSSEVTSWPLCVSILTQESPNWGGSASGRSRDARREKEKAPTALRALGGAPDTSRLTHYTDAPTHHVSTEGAGEEQGPHILSAYSSQAWSLALK